MKRFGILPGPEGSTPPLTLVFKFGTLRTPGRVSLVSLGLLVPLKSPSKPKFLLAIISAWCETCQAFLREQETVFFAIAVIGDTPENTPGFDLNSI